MKKIGLNELKSLLLSLASQGSEVYVPDEANKGFVRIDENIPLQTKGITRVSVKSILFPQTEPLMKWSRTGEPEEITPDDRKIVVFGVRPCDLNAIDVFDRVFAGDVVDPYYVSRRRRTIFLSLACVEPADESCFCTMIGGDPFARHNADALLIEVDDGFLIETLSEKGTELFKDAVDVAVVDVEEMAEKSRNAIGDNLSKIGLPTTVAIEPDRLWELFDSPIWRKTQEGCLGCGICSFLCPTCHCFDIVDERSKSGGRRIRVWDTCAFDVFTSQASGHNPRPTQKERMRQRVMHKFCYLPENVSVLGCVGCGRCVRYCPGTNDIRRVLVDLIYGISGGES